MKTLMLKTRIATIRNRAAAQAGDYNVVPTDRQFLDRWYTVTNRTDATRSYTVDTFMRTCDCPAFKREGYCKHCALVQKEQGKI